MEKLFPALLRCTLFAVSLSLITGRLNAADFYVAPNASTNGTGSFSSPWKLQTALNQPAAVHPGDTIWLRGGTYTGTYQSNLNGTSASPIIVRQYPGERATIDGGNSNKAAILFVIGDYTWFWGFEIMSSDTHRQTSTSGEDPPDIGRGNGFTTQQTSGSAVGVKFINMVIHDTRENDFWKESTDSEVYGSLIYYNGWEAPDRGHGHGLYVQNQTGTKNITDNIMFSGFSHGIHAYGSDSATLDNIQATGNTIFNSGELSAANARNILMGGGSVAHNPVVNDNFMYYGPMSGPQSALDMGYSAGCANATVKDNYEANNVWFVSCQPTAMTGNTFYGSIYGFSQSQYPNNTYYSSRPTGVKVFVRPNVYEAGRANVTVFNWDRQNTVNVGLAGILAVGTAFEVRNAQDFFGAPVLTGTYAGGNLSLPMTGLSVAAPVGWAAPVPTGPDFNAFVVLPVLGAPAPTATNTPNGGGSTPTPTRTPTKTPTKTPTSRTPSATPTKTPTPNGSAVTVRIEAESPQVSSPMATVSSSQCFGGQYIQTATANSGTGSWSFSVPSSGTYYVWGRVRATDGNHDSYFVKMDSGAEDIYDVAENTWSPNWQWTRLNGRGAAGIPLTLNPRTFSLSAGSHTLTFRGREVTTGLDRVIVTNDASFVPTETP